MFSVMTTIVPLCPKAKALVVEWGEETLQNGRGEKPKRRAQVE